MNKKKTVELASQVKNILESEERSYMSKRHKEQIYMNVMNEATSMMKRKPEATQSIVINQRVIDRAEFDYYYDNWQQETSIHSNLSIVFSNDYFKRIVAMGKRAVPFIYEKIREDVNFVVNALPEIYSKNVTDKKGYIDFDEYCALWCKKIEEEEDV